jgi:hypothetical protein
MADRDSALNVRALPGVLIDQPVNAQPCAALINMLATYLDEAKRGELQAIGLAGVRPNGLPVMASQAQQ